MPTFVDLSGQRYGRWTVKHRSGSKMYPSGNHQPQYLCLCDCGTERVVVSSILRDGSSKSCGCLNNETRSAMCTKRNTTHGAAAKNSTSITYYIWRNMVSRCHSPNSSGYHKYGARGIRVADHWRKFENFIADMGERPSLEYSIERENPFLGYQPGNCTWIPLSDQQNNKTNSAIRCKVDLLRVIDLYCAATNQTREQLIQEDSSGTFCQQSLN